MRYHLIAGGVVAAVVVAIVAGVLLVGSGQNSLAEAAERMDGQNVRMKMQIGYAMNGEEGTVTGEAVANANGSRMRMDMSIAEGGDEPLDMQLLMIRDDVWYTFAELEEFAGAEWIHAVDRSSAPETMTMAEFADFLANADRVESKGETQINGSKVEHFGGEVNVTELAKETGGETAKRFQQALGDDDLYLPIEVWIDEQGRPARMTMSIDDGGKQSMSVTADILEYGVKVDVQPPPESDTISEQEFEELTAGG